MVTKSMAKGKLRPCSQANKPNPIQESGIQSLKSDFALDMSQKPLCRHFCEDRGGIGAGVLVSSDS